LDGARWAAKLIESGRRDQNITITGRDWTMNGKNCNRIVNPLVETGLIYCRKVLGFMGIKRSRKTGRLRAIRPGEWQKNDVLLPQLRLRLVTVEELLSAPIGTRRQRRGACERMLKAADKGVAHFTVDRGERARAADLRICAETVSWALRTYVYARAAEPLPPNATVWTDTTKPL
jgi:hypothetical protein